jgi:myo-inositol-1(or 4)-monophosphatase
VVRGRLPAGDLRRARGHLRLRLSRRTRGGRVLLVLELVGLEAVERGLEVARGRVGAGDVAFKGARDLVTATDVAVEDTIRHVLGDTLRFPVVGEEGGGEASADGGSYWLVDPICGTRNFASGIPLYCVNVALVENDEVALGVVGDPSTGEIHVAERAHGAWALRGEEQRRLVVSDESQTIVIEGSHNDPEPARRERAAASVAGAIRAFRWDIRALSTTLALAYVAAGRVAAYVLFSASALHVAPGSVLAAEAGAVVSDIDGRPWTIRSESIVASATPALHDDLLALVQ